MMNLSELEIGKDAVIESVDCSEISLRKHILDMGLTPGTEISLIKIAPMGDPMEIRVRGYELTLRKDDASYIKIKNIHEAHKIEECKYEIGESLGDSGNYWCGNRCVITHLFWPTLFAYCKTSYFLLYFISRY